MPEQAPIVCGWSEAQGVLIPLSRFLPDCSKRFREGEIYQLVEWEDRSDKSHSHEFAWLKTAWLNLPENDADRFPTPEHLRKRALVETGFYNETIIDAGSNAAALRVAAYVRSREEFAVVIVRGPVVVVRNAKSQSRRAMDHVAFQQSKQAILELIAGMIGVTPEELTKQGTTL